MMLESEKRIIYISGRDGDANKGLGGYLKQVDPNRIGLSANKTFLKLTFEQQVGVVKGLLDEFDGPNTSVVANSYGAYLVLNALIEASKYQCGVMLLSPAIGGVLKRDAMAYSRQPNSKVFDDALRLGKITKPTYLSIHIGDQDGGYDKERFACFLNADLLNIIPNQGHLLERTTVVNILQSFLARRVV